MSKKKVAVVTDSTACLPVSLIEELGIPVIPLNVLWDGDELKDGVHITPSQFYTRLASSSTMPTTSQPSVGEFVEFYEKVAETADEIVGVFISDTLSGTLQSARQAKDMVDFPVHLIDSRITATPLGVMAVSAHKMAEAGANADEIVAAIKDLPKTSDVFFVADTLEFLHRGGRIGGAARFVGSLLSMKPILHVEDGVVAPLARVRTKKKALKRMMDDFVEATKGKDVIGVGVLHSEAAADANNIKKDLENIFPGVPVILSEITPVVGTHIGPGALGVGYVTR